MGKTIDFKKERKSAGPPRSDASREWAEGLTEEEAGALLDGISIEKMIPHSDEYQAQSNELSRYLYNLPLDRVALNRLLELMLRHLANVQRDAYMFGLKLGREVTEAKLKGEI